MKISVKRYLGSVARVLPLISTLMAWQFFPYASAATITVTQILPKINGIKKLALVDGKSVKMKVYGNTADGKSVLGAQGETMSGTGTLELRFDGDTANWTSLKIVGNEGGENEEIWENITGQERGQRIEYKSNKQKTNFKVPGSYQDRPNGLPFEFLPNFWSDAEGTFAQIDIISTSSLYAYSFTSLQLYKDLSPLYWQTDQFDSPAAIATGIFQWDYVADNGLASITKPGGEVAPILSFPLGTPSHPSYDLLTGVARPILAPGVYGDPTSFSTGFTPVPEPSSLAIVVLGCVVLGSRKRLYTYLHHRGD